MISELKDTSKVEALFAGWEETLIYSCLQNVMGKIYVTDPECLDEGPYPSWDAHDMNSVQLSRKFGYEFDHEYTAYEVASDRRTH